MSPDLIQKRIDQLSRRLTLGTDHRARLLTADEVRDIEIERARLTQKLQNKEKN